MRINLKAFLLSALVLPGLGQLVKGERLKGGCIIALVNIFILASVFVVLRAVGKLLAAGLDANQLAPAELLERVRADSPAARWLLTAFLALWLVSAVDAARNKH